MRRGVIMKKIKSYTLLSSVIASSLLLPWHNLSAQVLEEIVVTAQRREQSLQEVPISLEAYSGADLISGGLRTMQDVELFSPSVEIATQTRQMSTVIRGIGSSGGNYSIDPAAPIFVDGIHFGRASMISGAFLDVDRLEVLRGPQPIHFGQNATAGAFSINTRRPTPEWEGNVAGEIGNFGRKTIEAGVGGPITDTLGIRVAGQWDETTGHMTDVVDGNKYPYRRDAGGRITLSWQPTEAFSATLKAEYLEKKSDGDPNAVCLTPQGTFFGNAGELYPEKYETAVLVRGEVPAWDAIHRNRYALPDCNTEGYRKLGVADGDGEYFLPIAGVRSDNNRGGHVNMVDLAKRTALATGVVNPDCPLCSQDSSDLYNYRLGLVYQFDNGIELEAVTGIVDYFRLENEDPQPSPFFAEAGYRVEQFDMLSQELRLRSEAGGVFEWEIGAYYQKEDLDLTPSDDLRAGLDRPGRFNESWGDNRWASAFATITYNFLDNKASLDVGARYTDVHKESWMRGLQSTLIFNVNPDPDGDGLMPDTAGNTIFRFNTNPAVTNQNRRIIDCATGRAECGSYGAGFYTHLWRTRQLPALWAGNLTTPVDYGARLALEGGGIATGGIYEGTHDEDSLDPQITLRYRPNDDMSLYAKWAKAFKAGGFDTGAKAPPASQAAFTFEAENAENYEFGVKGTLLDGRARYDMALFWTIITDMQGETSGITITPEGEAIPEGSDAVNAGKARNRGIEFDLAYAATDRMTIGVSGAVMDAVYLYYFGAGCNDSELALADTSPCFTTAESIAEFGSDIAANTIDRTGSQLPRTPDWKFTLNMDYWHPVTDRYKATFDTRVSYSDGFIVDVTNYELINTYDTHANIDFNIGFGDIDDVWRLSLYGRNLLESGVEYFAEYDQIPNGHENIEKHQNQFFTYGLQLQYNFR